jgi:esterase/lipase superfamily enzyme
MKTQHTSIWRAATGALCLFALAACSTAPQTGSSLPGSGSGGAPSPESILSKVLEPLKKAMPPEAGAAPEPEAIVTEPFRGGADMADQIVGGAPSRAMRSAPPAMAAPPAVPSPVDPKKADAPFLTQRVFYGTNRKVGNASDPNTYYNGALSGKLDVGYCDVSIPLNHETGKVEAPDPLSWQYWFAGEFREDPKKHVVLLGVKPLERADFLKDLRNKMRAEWPQRKRCFVFVHGFNVPFRNAARRTAQMTHDLGFPGAPIFFSWPSQGGETNYFSDSDKNKESLPQLREFLEIIARDTDAQEIYLIAHSMGTRVTSAAVPDAYTNLGPLVRPKLKSLILAAPDIDTDVFNNEVVPKMLATGIPLTIYASKADLALQISRQVNGKPRVGQDPLFAASGKKGIDVIDASSVKTDFTEHNYFGSSPALIREFNAIFNGRRPAQRTWLQSQTAPAGGRYWVLPALQ